MKSRLFLQILKALNRGNFTSSSGFSKTKPTRTHLHSGMSGNPEIPVTPHKRWNFITRADPAARPDRAVPIELPTVQRLLSLGHWSREPGPSLTRGDFVPSGRDTWSLRKPIADVDRTVRNQLISETRLLRSRRLTQAK